MKNILLIEDDPIKLSAIRDFIINTFNFNVDTKMSYQSGLKTILERKYELVLLDMQLPNYDIKSGEDGYKQRPLAGRDILREIKRKKIQSRVVIITQYDSFGEDGKFVSWQEWDTFFSEQFKSIYYSTIFYNPASSSWKEQLKLFFAS